MKLMVKSTKVAKSFKRFKLKLMVPSRTRKKSISFSTRWSLYFRDKTMWDSKFWLRRSTRSLSMRKASNHVKFCTINTLFAITFTKKTYSTPVNHIKPSMTLYMPPPQMLLSLKHWMQVVLTVKIHLPTLLFTFWFRHIQMRRLIC